MANIIVMPFTNSRFIPYITMYPSITKSSLLTPFCAVAPHHLASATKIHIQITLETIYEEEDEKEFEATPASCSPTNLPNASMDLFIPNSPKPSFGSKFPCKYMYVNQILIIHEADYCSQIFNYQLHVLTSINCDHHKVVNYICNDLISSYMCHFWFADQCFHYKRCICQLFLFTYLFFI